MRIKRTTITSRTGNALALGVVLGLLTAIQRADAGIPERARAFVAGFEKAGAHFESNEGQLPSDARFCFRGEGYRLDLVDEGIVLRLTGDEVILGRPMRIRFADAHSEPAMTGAEKLPFAVMHRTMSNGVLGGLAPISTYASVVADDVYTDVDVRYYANQGRLEYDFVVAPGADPTRIALKFEGTNEIHLKDDGELRIAFPLGAVLQHRPYVYQEVEGKRIPVDAQYVMTGDETVGFRVGDYDPNLQLVIDPVLTVLIEEP